MALVPTLAPDPGADIAAQAQLMRQQKLAQLLANPPKVVEIDAGGGDTGGGDKGSSPEGNSILAKALSEDVAKTAGPSVANFDAPVSTGSQPTYSFTGGAGKSGLDPVANAQSLLGKEEHVDHDDIQNYLKTGGIGMDPAKVAWCAAFVNASLAKSGIPGTNSAAALSFSKWGQPVRDGYQRGDVMVFDRGGGHGHVGLLTGNTRNGLVEMISGNQGNRVSTSWENPASAMIRRYVEQNQQGAALTPPAMQPTPAPYKVASLGFQPPPRTQPIAPMQPPPAPAPAPAPAPTATPSVPPIPTMVGAPMPVTATPISPTASASLTDAPLPPSRSASGVDDMIKRQAASARPAFTEPEGFDLFDEIGRGLEELFGGGGDTGGGGPSPQQLGTQLASAGEEYYPMPPSNSHGILGLISDAFREPVPIPQEVRALANSPKQSDRLAYQLMVHGDQLGGNQSAMLTALYKEAREREQAQQNRLGEPFRDQYGNLVQIGPNGEYNIRQAAEKPPSRQTATVDGNVIDTQTGQVIYTAPQKPPAPVHVGDALVDPTTGREVYRAPAKPDESSMRIQNEVAAREQELRRRGLDPNEARNRDWVLTGKFPREDATPLTATDKKAILEADEMVETSQNALTAIQRAKEASKKAWGFKGAGPISALTAPFSEGAQNTVDLDNIVTSDALESLKATFGGNPTEGERAILLQIQGSSALPDAERQRIYDRAAAAIQRRLEFNKRRAQDMRGGSYYDQGHNPNNQGPAAGAQPSSGASPAPAKKIRYDANGNIVQ